MKQLYQMSDAAEKVNLSVEFSSVWETILGISGFTHEKLRHTFDLDEQWVLEEAKMSEVLRGHLKTIEMTNFWYALIMLQDEFSSPAIQDFSHSLADMTASKFYKILLPYKNRESEPLRRETLRDFHDPEAFEKYAVIFKDHEYLGEYIRFLGKYSFEETCDLLIEVVNGWHQWVSQFEEWKKWIQALEFEQKQYSSLKVDNPIQQIEQITNGIIYTPEPSVWNVKLVPHVSYRPWVLTLRSPETKIFFYPINDKYLLDAGVPSSHLIKGHKALGDDLRLKLLYQLVKGPLSLQDLSSQFNMSKTTLHHQLSLLKAAKFIKAEKGIYYADINQIQTFSGLLTEYLGGQI
ncbi:ArsR family transcriptional regulator [Bacillus sp. MUM 13]|uniref:ArsR/SmtB family transcription factor n=1 Tax=Bacillus sp. MUM 13 TaxID=1678001 RepID=UPI0009F383CE|nr:ArsR family transcriptional regulator [Bacillus sp. MUM 13]